MDHAALSLMSYLTNRAQRYASASAHWRSIDTGELLTPQGMWRCVCRRRLEDLSPLISIWQFDFKPVMMTAPRSFVTIGFSVKLPVCLRLWAKIVSADEFHYT